MQIDKDSPDGLGILGYPRICLFCLNSQTLHALLQTRKAGVSTDVLPLEAVLGSYCLSLTRTGLESAGALVFHHSTFYQSAIQKTCQAEFLAGNCLDPNSTMSTLLNITGNYRSTSISKPCLGWASLEFKHLLLFYQAEGVGFSGRLSPEAIQPESKSRCRSQR